MDSNLWWLAAKTSKQSGDLWLPLVYHLRDTAEVMDYLLHHWVARVFYTEIDLSRRETIRVACFLAMAHDLGKASPLFQSQITRTIPDIKTALFAHDLKFADQYQNMKDVKHAHAGAELLRYMGVPDSVAVVAGAHHGKPEDENISFMSPEEEIQVNYEAYGAGRQEWQDVQHQIVQEALEKAGYQSTSELPELSEEAQMLLTGLLIVADWIASNTVYFPLISTDTLPQDYDRSRAEAAMEKVNLPEPYSISDYWKNSSFFRERFGFEPNQVQQAVLHQAEEMQTPGLMILEAPMGEGKTEAALAAAEVMMNRFDLGGIAFFLPSQATSNAMFDRILQWIENQPDADHVAIELTHSNAKINAAFRELREGCVQTQEDESNLLQKASVHSFFDGKKTKLLANVVVGTVDQLLMAALKQKHVMLRQLGLMGKVVVIDECHAYDAYMSVYLQRILEWLSAYEIPVILLSATLPGARRAEFLSKYSKCKKKDVASVRTLSSYPLITTAESWFTSVNRSEAVRKSEISYEKPVRSVWIKKETEEQALEEIRDALSAGGCIGIILNTIARVQRFAKLLEESFPEAELCIDHSHFLLPDRMEREEEILKRVGKQSTPQERKHMISLGTQVLEQSLNLDFDLLITDLCPMDLLMQRIGREHRHERVRPHALEKAVCVILNGDAEHLEDGAKSIYGSYLLKRTALLLPDEVVLPKDIAILVQRTYDETEGRVQLPQEYEEYDSLRKKKIRKAQEYCLESPSSDRYDNTILGLLDDDPGRYSEAQARAAVRDTADSFEVLAVQDRGDGYALILSGEHRGMAIDMTRQPSMQEAEILEEQRIRLPGKLSMPCNYDENQNILVNEMEKKIPEWMNQPVLMDELIMVLDANADFRFGNDTLHYDTQKGLYWKEGQRDGERI